MADITNIPAPRVPFIDSRTGFVSREWYLFLLNLFNLTGGGSNTVSIEDLQLGPVTQDSSILNPRIQSTELTPRPETPDQVMLDYVEFRKYPAAPRQRGVMAWDANTDTLNLFHTTVVQPLGRKTFARVPNSTLSTFAKGTVVGLEYAGLVATGNVILYLADGSSPHLAVIGVCAEDIPAGQAGLISVWGPVDGINTTGAPYGETWAMGTILYASPTIAGGMTMVKPTAPQACIPLALVTGVPATLGSISVRPTIEQVLLYGQFIKTTTQSPAAINTAYMVTWDTTLVSNGVSLGTPTSRVVMANSGLYLISIQLQLTSSSASVKNVWFWFRKNGVNIADSSTIVSLDSGSAIIAPSLTVFGSFVKDDYLELMFAADNVNIAISTIAATAFAPRTPGAFLSVQQAQQ